MNNATIEARKETRNKVSKVLRPATKSEWSRVALICMLFVVAGEFRYWQDRQFHDLARKKEVSPFPLSEFPKELGSWRAKEGSETTLEPDIARIAGASDHLIRTYVDQKSEEAVVVMILYGLAKKVWAHVPTECYPANGFQDLKETTELDIPVPGKATTARFRMEHFAKYRPGERELREVYHSFLYDDEWGLDVGRFWKKFRSRPGMYKVQVQRQTPRSSNERENESLDEFLGLVVREIEQNLDAKR
jgi:Protein of unknown function (DUF3485)